MRVFLLYERGEDEDVNLVGSVGHREGGTFGADVKGGDRMGKGREVNEKRGKQRSSWKKYTCI